LGIGIALVITIVSGLATIGCLAAWAIGGAKNRRLQQLTGLFAIVCVLSYMLPKCL
jgi:hypothetical protein